MKKTLVILSCLIAQGIFLSPSAHANPECPGTNLCIANTIDGGGGTGGGGGNQSLWGGEVIDIGSPD